MAFRLTMAAPRGGKGLKRVYKAARKAAMQAGGEHWKEHILPGHFRAGAEAKYRYKKRTEKYERRKRREGRDDPLVYTGRLRDKMLAKSPRAKVNKRGLTMTWRGLPRYTYITDTIETVKEGERKGQTIVVKRPNKPAEITAMNKADANAVAGVFRKEFKEFLKARGYRP